MVWLNLLVGLFIYYKKETRSSNQIIRGTPLTGQGLECYWLLSCLAQEWKSQIHYKSADQPFGHIYTSVSWFHKCIHFPPNLINKLTCLNIFPYLKISMLIQWTSENFHRSSRLYLNLAFGGNIYNYQ